MKAFLRLRTRTLNRFKTLQVSHAAKPATNSIKKGKSSTASSSRASSKASTGT